MMHPNLASLLAALGVLAASPASAQDDWRAERPDVGPPLELTLPAFERAMLDNGMVVLVARIDQLPLVALSLVTKGGAALDPPGRPGLGSLVYGMLDEGAGKRDALAFSDAVADLGASFASGVERDRGSVTAAGLKRHAEALVDLLADAVRRPRFATDAFTRLKARAVAGLQARLGSPTGIAFLRLPAMVYGPSHPLGHPPSGYPASVGAITVEEVQAHHRRLLAPGRSAFLAVGDVTLDEAVTLAKRGFGDWTVEAPLDLTIPPVEAEPRSKILFVDKPKSPQTMVILARPLFGRGHPDEHALRLANVVFGGGFSSRLNMNLREDKGYTYGAGSQLALRSGVGIFLAYSALQRAYSVPGLQEFFRELRGLRTEPIRAIELARVKRGFVRSLPGDFETVSSLANAAAELFAYDLPLDHYARLADQVRATELSAAREVALRYLDPERMQILIVGDAHTVVPVLKDAGFGPIDVQPAAAPIPGT